MNDPNAAGKATGLPLSQLQDVSTFESAGWAIVSGWAPFDAPDTGAVDPNIHRVWGICAGLGATGGYPYLLWEYTESEAIAAGCAEAQSGAGSSTAAPPEKQTEFPAIHLDLQVTVGQQISGAPVVIGGEGLAGGSNYTLIVRSTPQTVESGTGLDPV